MSPVWLAIGGAVLASIVGVFVFAVRSANATSPQGIVPRLLKARKPYDVRQRGFGMTWNPGRPWGSGNWIYGSGTGTYWLDADGLVHLDWRPAKGAVVHLVGPIPSVADPRDPSRRRGRRNVRA